MKKRFFYLIAILCLSLLAFTTTVFSAEKTYKASLAQLTVAAENEEKGVLVDLVKLWSKATGNNIFIKVYPFKRSLENAISHESDFHIPLIKNPYKTEAELGFDYSTSEIFKVNFVLYTNKGKPIDNNKLSDYKITTDAAHVDFFNFKIGSEFSIESALNKLSLGRIDGFIFADSETDPVLIKLGLKNIKRELYRTYSVHAVLPRGEKGKGPDLMITEGMDIIKKNGEYSKLMDTVFKAYDDWQP